MKKFFMNVILFSSFLSFNSHSSESFDDRIQKCYDNIYKLPSRIVLAKKISTHFEGDFFVGEDCCLLTNLSNNTKSGLSIQLEVEDSIYSFVDHLRHKGVMKDDVDKNLLKIEGKKFELIWSIIDVSLLIK